MCIRDRVYIAPSADPTQIVREVNVPNTKKLSIRIIKQDKDTKIPLQGWKLSLIHILNKGNGSYGSGSGQAKS